MSWNPDSGLPLTNPPISVTAVEETAMKLWAEFLGGWFDGTPHELRETTLTLPTLAKLTFQEMALPEKDGLFLQVTSDTQGQGKRRLMADGNWTITHDHLLNFWFRAKVKAPRADGRNSLDLVRWGADTLNAILTSYIHTAPLTRCGMYCFSPQPHKLINGGDIAMRHLPCRLRYIYPAHEDVDSGEDYLLMVNPDDGFVPLFVQV